MNIFTTFHILEQLAIVFTCLFFSLFFVNWGASALEGRLHRQKKLIKNYAFPPSVKHHVQQTYPHLTDTEIELALEQLRVYFLICWQENETLTLPSKVVDTARQGFMLERKSFKVFQRAVFTPLMHQIPTRPEIDAHEIGLKEGSKTFKAALALVRVSSVSKGNSGRQIKEPAALHIPALFAVDEALNIPDGYLFADEAIQLMGSFQEQGTVIIKSSDI